MATCPVTRIVIEDLPPLEDLTPEELELIFGAGKRKYDTRRTLLFESLEERRVMTAGLTASLADGLLRIEGTEAADHILVRSDHGQISVEGAQIQVGTDLKDKVSASQVASMEIFGLGGDDVIDVVDALDVGGDIGTPGFVKIDGGDGRDLIRTLGSASSLVADPNDIVTVDKMALIQQRLEDQGVVLGQAITNETAHRDAGKGVVQQFRLGDVRLSGNDVEVYYASDRTLREYTLSAGGQLIASEDAVSAEYEETDFMNYRAAYARRSTLLVLTHGGDESGLPWEIDDGTDRGYAQRYTQRSISPSSNDWNVDWVPKLSSNLARELNAAGSMVHVMWVDWASQSPNSGAFPKVADHIKDFLSQRDEPWDVSLIGHSRGAIFNAEVTAALAGNGKIAYLQLVMLDPTAAISLNDRYPAAVPAGVSNAVVYDDGLVFAPLGVVHDSQPIAGADYVRVDVPDAGGNPVKSHNRLAEWYGEVQDRRGLGRTEGARDLTFQRDLGWMLAHDPATSSAVIPYDPRVGRELVVAPPPSNGLLHAIDIGAYSNRNGDAGAYISILGIGGGTVSIGKTGLNVAGGVTMVANALLSFSDHGLVVGFNGPGYGPLNVNAQVMIGPDSRLDADLGPLHLSMFGPGAGVYMGGQRIAFPSVAQISASNLQLQPSAAASFLHNGFGANGAEIAQVLGQKLGMSLGTIAAALRDGLGATVDQVAAALKTGLNATTQAIAGALGGLTHDAGAIASAMRSQLNASFNTIADALYNGISWTGYRDVAKGLGDITRDAGAIASAMQSQLNASLNTIADALYNGISWTGYRDVAKGLGNITRDAGAIASAMRSQLNASFNTIADALYNGISWTGYRDVAKGLGNITRDASAIASAMRSQLNASFNTIADALYNGISWTGYRDVAKGLGDITRDAGAIASAMQSQLNASLNTIADALYNGISWTGYRDVAKGLGDITRDAGAIASAMQSQLNASLNTIADALYNGISWTGYRDVAKGLGNITRDAGAIASAMRSQLNASFNTIADALYNGISWTGYRDVAKGLGNITRDAGTIASAMRSQLNASFNTIADALYNGISWTGYRDVAKGLGNITRDAGAIASAMRSQLNASFNTIADALYNGISWTGYRDVAKGLGNITRDAGAIASAMRSQLNASFNTIADALYNGISWTGYQDVANGLKRVTSDAAAIASALRNGAGAAASTVNSIIQSIGSGLSNLGSVGSVLGSGLSQGASAIGSLLGR